MRRQRIYPFTAIVGQERMKRALILNAVNPGIGGVLIRGERGTAKSTAARALAALLPEIEVIADSPFSDNPHRPDRWSDLVQGWSESGRELTTETRRRRFVDLPVGATEDRVVGTLDIERAIKFGEKRFEAGILASANRGILYVDEVNLLDDHIVDLLLDSAAMGVNVVEREGISFTHPASFILIGTMNPEEGELRPQLVDRFGLSVEIRGLVDTEERLDVLERHIFFDTDPEGFAEKWMPAEQQLSQRIGTAAEQVNHVEYTRRHLYTIATLTSDLQIDGHRADLVILKTARANAAFEGRAHIINEDILIAAELALPHRIRRGPFSEASLDADALGDAFAQIVEDAEGEGEIEAADTPADSKKKRH
jgi:Mg-chelatase subunit ChlI